MRCFGASSSCDHQPVTTVPPADPGSPRITRQHVWHQVLAMAVGYLAGLTVLLLWPGRAAIDSPIVPITGTAIAVVVGLAVQFLAFGIHPTFGARRPFRYSIPNFVGLLSAFFVASTIRDSAVYDAGLLMYAVVLPVIAGGATIADLLWADSISRATQRDVEFHGN
jgi:hypothetical protein